ncbi:hypothetical protein B0H13DRAFT_2663493 [Mycena leptocephala]|nr:hypothetical protein B0H13DRAFT_2663493 [Mycena leptocephala]
MLAVAFGVYFYRDIFPFATYTWPQQDAAEGPILHAKLITLTLAAVIVPLVTPGRTFPSSPRCNPMPAPNPEQTASPLSLLLFTFLDPVILLAYKLPHLPYDLLPPLADSDSSEHLKKREHRYVLQSEHVSHLLGIIRTFRKEYATILITLLIYVVCAFASPISINRVLSYLEKGPGDSAIRPLVWILWLMFGPLTGTASVQAYYRLLCVFHLSTSIEAKIIVFQMRILVQVEGLLTELIFEHALRVRVKVQNPDADLRKTRRRPTTRAPPTGH